MSTNNSNNRLDKGGEDIIYIDLDSEEDEEPPRITKKAKLVAEEAPTYPDTSRLASSLKLTENELYNYNLVKETITEIDKAYPEDKLERERLSPDSESAYKRFNEYFLVIKGRVVVAAEALDRDWKPLYEEARDTWLSRFLKLVVNDSEEGREIRVSLLEAYNGEQGGWSFRDTINRKQLKEGSSDKDQKDHMYKLMNHIYCYLVKVVKNDMKMIRKSANKKEQKDPADTTTNDQALSYALPVFKDRLLDKFHRRLFEEIDLLEVYESLGRFYSKSDISVFLTMCSREDGAVLSINGDSIIICDPDSELC